MGLSNSQGDSAPSSSSSGGTVDPTSDPSAGANNSFGSRFLDYLHQSAPVASGLANGVTGSKGSFGDRFSAFMPSQQNQDPSAYANTSAVNQSTPGIDQGLMSKGTSALNSGGGGGGVALLKLLLG